MKKIVVGIISLVVIGFIIYSNFFYSPNNDEKHVKEYVNSSVSESTVPGIDSSSVKPSPLTDDAIVIEDTDEFDESHMGEDVELYDETESGVFIDNMSLVRGDLEDASYDAFMFMINSGDYGTEIKLIPNSLIVSDHIVKFLFYGEGNRMYRATINNKDINVEISLF